MTSAAAGALDEAYERLHATGPEFDGWLSNRRRARRALTEIVTALAWPSAAS